MGMMRALLLSACVSALAAGCGDSVTEHIDALRGTGRRFVHEQRPPAADPPDLALRLREEEGGRAVLDKAEKAVPELTRLLDDRERGTLAAVLLAEIGGAGGAGALLDRWRQLRDDTRQICLRHVPDVGVPIGSRFENVDGELYGELLGGLGRAGQPVAAAIAGDTEVAMAESERLYAAGAPLTMSERREEDGRQIELRWSVPPVETAREGLTILAVLGAPEAPSLVERALRGPVLSLRRAALKCIAYLGERAEPMLPLVARMLDDPDWHDEARRQLAALAETLTEEQRAGLTGRYMQRLQAPRGSVR